MQFMKIEKYNNSGKRYLRSKLYMHLNVWREFKTFPILKSQGRRLLEVIFEANEQFRHVHLDETTLSSVCSLNRSITGLRRENKI